jgi:hypothetical protein
MHSGITVYAIPYFKRYYTQRRDVSPGRLHRKLSPSIFLGFASPLISLEAGPDPFIAARDIGTGFYLLKSSIHMGNEAVLSLSMGRRQWHRNAVDVIQRSAGCVL